MNATSLIREHRYSAQVTLVMLLISFITFATVKLEIPSSPWHITWMVMLPLALGVGFNKGLSRWFVAPVLLIVSLLATTVIGTAMGGI